MSKRILIISPNQFGYLTDYYYFCKYLRDEFEVHLICFDRKLPKRKLDGVDVQYVSFSGNKIKRYRRWLGFIRRKINQNSFDVVFLESHKLNLPIRLLLSNKNIVLDIRTGAVSGNTVVNFFHNLRIRLESRFFKRISIISPDLGRYLRLNPNKSHWLPLGAEIINGKEKYYGNMKLLYVGSLSQRKINETLEGFARFCSLRGKQQICSYDIFGFGTREEEQYLIKQIEQLKLEGIIRFHGRKNHDEIREYFEECTVGVSFVPITPYYDFQPPTKTFEYVLSGMVCVATSTYENSQLITGKNGVLCKDNAGDFFEALQKIYKRRNKYRQKDIIASLQNYSWDKIVKNKLVPYLNEGLTA